MQALVLIPASSSGEKAKKKKNKRPGKRDREKLLRAEGGGQAQAPLQETSAREGPEAGDPSEITHAPKRRKATEASVASEAPPQADAEPKLQWNFEVDYNDHFETPLLAFADLLPYLQKVGEQLSPPKAVGELVLYDPYWCQGRMRALLHSLGVRHVINENRDFYADIAAGKVPAYDVLVTNPPYSGEHKTRLLGFLSSPVAGHAAKPFALLLPAYTAGKAYWRSYLLANPADTEAYLLPAAAYEYSHPEGTGHAAPPFYSAWFLGRFPPLAVLQGSQARGSTLVGAVADLVARGHVVEKRLNPKQRRKLQNKQS